eukprot:CAMPEP_0194328576 /NCGR_PEP_ID=MMETSP0171-20130528/45333_1 /TAXON_ID=218684 /ORGANISM="Corethron pennatum, Strain L29A3" /LENGTH=93 /DNA_ID=CAMNT_0039088979 /DNA_START=79 /DNA_END=357 /DNA_ORIENTATION=-
MVVKFMGQKVISPDGTIRICSGIVRRSIRRTTSNGRCDRHAPPIGLQPGGSNIYFDGPGPARERTGTAAVHPSVDGPTDRWHRENPARRRDHD